MEGRIRVSAVTSSTGVSRSAGAALLLDHSKGVLDAVSRELIGVLVGRGQDLSFQINGRWTAEILS